MKYINSFRLNKTIVSYLTQLTNEKQQINNNFMPKFN